MLMRWTMLTCILFLGSIGASKATPLDSPDIVYVDGLPCNRACQSYMAWYRQVTMSRQRAPVSAQPEPLQLVEQPPRAEAQRTTRMKENRLKSSPPIRATKKGAPKPVDVLPAKTAGLQPADRGGEAKPATPEKIAASPPISNPTSGSDAGTTPEQIATAPPVQDLTTATASPAPEQKADSIAKPSGSQPADRAEETKSAIPEKITASPPISSPTSGSDAVTAPEQVATAPAVQDLTTATASPVPEPKADSDTKPTGRAEVAPPAARETAALAPPNSSDQLVAILLVRLDIKSVSDLANKKVAIDVSRSESVPTVRTAIAAAGAAEVQMTEGEKPALARVIDGEVPAAVLTLASPEEAEMWSAGMPGFKILRIPLSPASQKARRG
jgi:hypothetical protein